MGVCTEERSVMHWQSARYLETTREQNSPIEAHSGNHCSDSSYNHLLHRSCTSCIKGSSKICLKNDDQHLNDPSGRSFDRSDRRMFDESSMNYSDGSRNDCYELGDSIKHADTALLFKSEPCGPPSSPESSCEAMTPSGPDGCAGCGQIIQDRFYLSAVEKRWHATCLQCCVCRQTLDRETSCFARDENIYCKSDYYRVFGTKRCSRCLASISPSELVMRARNLVFHVNCFSCAVCHLPLTKGDQFGVRDSIIYCRLHFGMSIEIQITPSTSLPNSSYNTSFSPSQNTLLSSLDAKKMSPNDFCVPSAHVISGMQQPPRQKGRPRKRKPKDIDALTANIDLTTEYLDFSRGGHLGSSSRTKRMRTSFKHHQLRTMKSYFAVNHNPDAKDLKQLSQKTGLPKRVLQVWFQNARAKWRRMMMKQDGKGMIDRGDGSLDLDSFSAHSPSSYILGGPPSPQSLD